MVNGEKILHSEGHPESFTELHEEEEREEGDRDEQEEKKGTQGERDRSMQLSVPRVFSIAQTPTEIHRIGLGREGERRK